MTSSVYEQKLNEEFTKKGKKMAQREWGRGYSLLEDDNVNDSGNNLPQNAGNKSNKGSQDINEIFLQSLVDMGYEERIAKASLVKTSSQSLEVALDWFDIYFTFFSII